MSYLDNHQSTAELQSLDAAHHIHPFSDTKDLNAKGSRIIVRGQGVYLYDNDGRQILDGMAGLWNVNLGYGRQEIVDAVSRQMSQLPYYNTFFQTSHPPVIALAERLTALAPDHLNRAFFCCSGSEANDTVLRLARHYWANLGKPEKSIIIGRHNGYHGSTLAGSSLGGMSAMHDQGGLTQGIVHINQPYWYGEGGNQDPDAFGLARAKELEAKILELGEDKIAAFIAEPIQGAGGVIIPPATYWPEIQRICDKYEILLITDEVICAFGRTGNMFACETFGTKPDLVPMAKGMSSGYQPLGGVLVSDRVVEGLEAGGEFYHGYTYSGHPAACAAGLATLEIMARENLVETVGSQTAPYLQQRWASLAEHPLVGEARMTGMMGALELTSDKQTRAPFAAETGTVGGICRDHCFDVGLVMRAVRDSMIISPPLVITNNEIDELVDKARQALDRTLASIKEL